MPSPKRYPLEVLARHRDDAVQQCARELGLAQRQQNEAVEESRHRQTLLQDHLSNTQLTIDSEISRTLEGDANVGDLARLFAWQAGQKLEERQLSAQVQDAKEREDEVNEQLCATRQQLLESHRDAEVIHKHREKFEMLQRKAREQFEEEEANEASYTRKLKG
jgi:hypothetical protein